MGWEKDVVEILWLSKEIQKNKETSQKILCWCIRCQPLLTGGGISVFFPPLQNTMQISNSSSHIPERMAVLECFFDFLLSLFFVLGFT